jgi:hypothetical protein
MFPYRNDFFQFNQYGRFASPLRFGLQPSTLGLRRSPYMVFTAFVFSHLLAQLGNVHASMPAALVLTINHSCCYSFHKNIYEGSESLRAKAQVFVFLARFDAKASLAALSHIDK